MFSVQIPDLLFGLFSLLTLLTSFLVVTTPSPIHAVLFLVGSFASSGSLLILFGAEYIGIIFFILYVGAISVVFLFVIMMLDIKQAELKETLRGRLARYFPVGGVLSFVVLGFLIYALANDSSVMYSTSIFTFISQDAGTATELTQMVNTNAHEAPYLTWYALADSVTNLEALGLVLYTHYFLHFILASMLLLVSMIIVIVLTGFRYEHIKHQDLFDQQASRSDEAWYAWNGKD
jgi:NADH-quinone oxidoreductase subunit J